MNDDNLLSVVKISRVPVSDAVKIAQTIISEKIKCKKLEQEILKINEECMRYNSEKADLNIKKMELLLELNETNINWLELKINKLEKEILKEGSLNENAKEF